MFPDAVYTNATLLVPGGTVKKYQATAAWNEFANIVPTAIGVTMTATAGGSISLGDVTVTDDTQLLQVKPNSVLTFEITPEETHFLKSLVMNETDVTSQVVNGQFTPTDLSEDIELTATFKAKPYYTVTATASAGGTATVAAESVMMGRSTTVTLTANEGYELTGVTVNGVDKTSEVVDGVLTLSDIQENQTVVATFQKFRYNVTAAESENGSILLSATEVEWGDDVTATLVPAEHYETATVSVNGEDMTALLNDGQLAIADIRQNTTVEATYQLQTFDVSETHNAGGSVTLSADRAQWGSNVTVTIVPDDEHYLGSVTVNDMDVTEQVEDGQYAITVDGNTVVAVTFVAKPYYTVTAAASVGGTATVGNASVMMGRSTTVTFSANEGYELISVTVNGADRTADVNSGVLALDNIMVNTTVEATFQKMRFEIATTAGEGGSIQVSDTHPEWGDDVTVTIVPDEDYVLATLTVDGNDVSGDLTDLQYTLSNVRSNVELFATFRSIVAFITISSAGVGTYCSDQDLDFSSVSGMNAYIASGFIKKTGTVILLRVTDVPAYEGLIVKGEPGEYKVPFSESSAYYVNMLKGNVESVYVDPTEGDMSNFYLSNGSNGLNFYRVAARRKMSANRAILQLPTQLVSNAPTLNVVFDDEDTGVRSVQRQELGVHSYYNLNGQRVAEPKKGLYIKDGKKLLVK